MTGDTFPGGRGNIFGSSGTAPKPTEEETPYRSRYYVSAFRSTDGQSYHPGDPIPFEEAVRQGVINPDAPPPRRGRCERCNGGKWFTNPRPKGHKIGCRCRFCGPCPRCAGSGREPEEKDGDTGSAAGPGTAA